MIRRTIVAGLVLACASSAVPPAARAAAGCHAPYPPTMPAGGIVGQQQIADLRGDVQAFIGASDLYQTCISDAEASGVIDLMAAEGLASDNQQQKTKVAAAFNAAIATFTARLATR